MEDVLDLDLVVSKNTTNQLEKVLYEYKLRILRDLAQNIDVPFKNLKKQFMEREVTYKNRYYGPDRSKIEEEKCMARVWHKQLGPVQCSRSAFEGGTKPDSDYCKLHLDSAKRRYGRIDEEVVTPETIEH